MTDRLAAIGHGVPVTPAVGRVTVKDLIAAWLVALEERGARGMGPARSKAKALLEGLGHLRVARLTPDVVRRYIAARRGDELADGSIRGELLSLTAALNLARKEQRIVYAPYIPKPPASPARQSYPEPETLAKILPHLEGAYRDAIDFADATARRSGEVVGLQWPHVFRRDSEIRLGMTKNGDPLTIPLEGRVAAIMERRWSARRLDCLFVFHDDGAPLNQKTLLRRFKAACEAAGVATHLVHDLRRSGVRNLRRAGVAEDVAMSISGHRDRGIFRRYNITSTEDKRAAMRAADRYVAQRALSDNLSDNSAVRDRKRGPSV